MSQPTRQQILSMTTPKEVFSIWLISDIVAFWIFRQKSMQLFAGAATTQDLSD